MKQHRYDAALGALLVSALAFIVVDSRFDLLYTGVAVLFAVMAISIVSWRTHEDWRSEEEAAQSREMQSDLLRATLAHMAMRWWRAMRRAASRS